MPGTNPSHRSSSFLGSSGAQVWCRGDTGRIQRAGLPHPYEYDSGCEAWADALGTKGLRCWDWPKLVGLRRRERAIQAVRSDGVWGRQRGGSGSKAHKELKGGEEGVESEIGEAPRHDGTKMEVNFMGGPWLSA